MIFLYALAGWILLSPLVGLACGHAIRHGEQQARHTRTARHKAAHAPRWARTDHHTHRRTR